jgi:hypothetical protein
MENWTIWGWSLLFAGVFAALCGLHRVALWMEDRGWIYYIRKKPRSSPLGSFIAFQKIIEPQAEHVIHVFRANHDAGDEETSGQGRGEGSGWNAD